MKTKQDDMDKQQQQAAVASERVESSPHTAARAPLLWLQLFVARNFFILLLLSGVFLSAIAVVGSSHKSRTVFYELQEQRQLHNELEVQWGQLLIEQSTFGTEGRIERRAVDELDMRQPDWSGIVMVRHE